MTFSYILDGEISYYYNLGLDDLLDSNYRYSFITLYSDAYRFAIL